MDPALGVPVCLAMVAVVVVVGTVLVRRWLRRMSLTMRYAVDFPPPRVHLEPALEATASLDEAMGPLVARLEALGFHLEGSWQAPELGSVVLRGLRHPEQGLLAAVYHHEHVGVFADIVAQGPQGQTLTATSAPTVSALELPPTASRLHRPGATIDALWDAMEEALPGLDWRPLEPGPFQASFEAAWARELDWRCARGGPSREEIRRVAALDGHALDDAQVQLAWSQLHLRALDGLDEILRERIVTTLPHLAGRAAELLLIHDQLEGDPLWDEVESWLGDAAARSRRPGPPREVFAAINAALEPGRRLRLVGTLEEPIATDLYTGSPA